MSDFAKKLIKKIADDHTTILADGLNSAEPKGWIDTGSYLLNLILSGDMFKGCPDNKMVTIAGETTTGKTFFVRGIAVNFLKSNPDAIVVYYDTERAVTRTMFESAGVHPDRVIMVESPSIESFRLHLNKLLKEYEACDKATRPPMMVVLDSLGGQPSSKLIDDTEKGEIKADPGRRAQIIKQTIMMHLMQMAHLQVPFLVTNHVYTVTGAYVPTKKMSGGSGPEFFSDVILFLSKKKVKDGTEVTGNIITIKLQKSRLARENAQVEVLLDYTKGLDRHHGLVDLGVNAGVIKRVSNKYEFPDGRKAFGKDIAEHPEEWLTPEIVSTINDKVSPLFHYGSQPAPADPSTG